MTPICPLSSAGSWGLQLDLRSLRAAITGTIGEDARTAELYFPITKVERGEDDTRYVYGKATGPDLDLDQQIIDADFAKAKFPEWFKSWGNIRQMHSKNLAPAGKAVELVEGDDGQWLKSHIVEAGAIKLIDAGVYQAYSVGLTNVKIIRDADAPNGRIVGGDFVETSLVDYPANPTCKFAVVKRASAADAWVEAEDVVDLEKLPEAVLEKIVVAEAAKSEEPEPVEEPSDPVEGDEKLAAPLVLKRFHDAFCPCYGLDKVAEAHPVLAKNGAMLELGPEARTAVWAMLQQEVQEDSGTGKNAWSIDCLSDLYCSVSSWVASELYEAAYEILASARTQLHKQFDEAYPDAALTPADPPEAGSFSRGYLAAGHAAQNGGDGARLPEVSVVSSATFTGKAEDAAPWLLGLHDRVAKLFPEICGLEKAPEAVPVEAVPVEAAPAEVVPAPAEVIPPVPVVEPAAVVVPLVVDGALVPVVLDPNATATPQKVDLAEQVAPEIKAVDPDELARAVEALIAPREEAHKAEIAELKKQIDEISREPDPAKAPFRGTSVVAKSITPDEERGSALKAAQERDESEYIEYLERQAQHHPTPDVRQRAQEQLDKRAASQSVELVKA